MYAAKTAGKGNYKLYRPEMRSRAVGRLQRESDLGAHPRLTAAHQPAVISTTATIAAPTPTTCGARRRSPRTTIEHSTVDTG
jgi:hypothetical protein